MKKSESATLRTLDLFCGAGGCSIGVRQAGGHIVAGIDFWKEATTTFKANFLDSLVFTENIEDFSPAELRKRIGEIDLIVASPECTNHSCAKGNGSRSEESKNTAFQVTRFARDFRPKWLVVENVIQMQSWSRHTEFLEELWELDYFVLEQKLDAKHFGVQQSRRRLFLLCSLSGESSSLQLKNRKFVPASSIIDRSDKYSFSPLFSPKRAQPTIERAERAIDALGPEESFLLVYYGTDGSGGWQSLDNPLRTVTTLDRFAYIIPSKKGHMMRMLQPDELKLAMGFPKRFKNDESTRRNRIKLLGNAVCLPVMKRIVQSLTSVT